MCRSKNNKMLYLFYCVRYRHSSNVFNLDLLSGSNVIQSVFLTECQKWWFGDKCGQKCKGHCRDNSTCNHVTGQCDEGCDPGWTGTRCDDGRFNIFSIYDIFR